MSNTPSNDTNNKQNNNQKESPLARFVDACMLSFLFAAAGLTLYHYFSQTSNIVIIPTNEGISAETTNGATEIIKTTDLLGESSPAVETAADLLAAK